MLSLFTALTRLYIAGNDLVTEGVWKWTDGSLLNDGFTNWETIYLSPDNYMGNENCLEIRSFYGYNWNDVNCDLYLSSICEYPLVNS